jgi:hypothetical protein
MDFWNWRSKNRKDVDDEGYGRKKRNTYTQRYGLFRVPNPFGKYRYKVYPIKPSNEHLAEKTSEDEGYLKGLADEANMENGNI